MLVSAAENFFHLSHVVSSPTRISAKVFIRTFQ
jgi:hypothetical protein